MGREALERTVQLLAAVAASIASTVACTPSQGPSARDTADATDTGRTLAAKSESERAVLQALPKLPSGTVQRVGGITVVADAPYAAASGRTCRALHVAAGPAQPTRDKLACNDGKSWFFVPDVFGSASVTE